MKKLFLVTVFFMLGVLLTGCEDQSKELEQQKKEESEFVQNKIDPVKDCPQNDRNCNGVPDDEE